MNHYNLAKIKPVSIQDDRHNIPNADQDRREGGKEESQVQEKCNGL